MAARQNRTIEVTGMTGAACIERVTTAVKGVDGVKIDAVAMGTVTINCEDQGKAYAACSAINAAGFRARPLPVPGANRNKQPGAYTGVSGPVATPAKRSSKPATS